MCRSATSDSTSRTNLSWVTDWTTGSGTGTSRLWPLSNLTYTADLGSYVRLGPAREPATAGQDVVPSCFPGSTRHVRQRMAGGTGPRPAADGRQALSTRPSGVDHP